MKTWTLPFLHSTRMALSVPVSVCRFCALPTQTTTRPKRLGWPVKPPPWERLSRCSPNLVSRRYSNEDLFHQDALLDATRAALEAICCREP